MRLAAVSMLVCGAVSAQTWQEAAKTRIAAFPGEVSLYAKNLDTGAAFGIRENDPVRTASTIKLPVLCAVHDLVSAGKAKWTDLMTVRAADKVSGSGIIGSEISDGVELPLRDVTNLMMVLSDNTATNMVLERFTADAVNAYLDRIGIRTTRSMRKVRGDGTVLKEAEGWSAAGRLPENQKYGIGRSTPRDMVTILERLDKGEIVSPRDSAEVLEVMKRCQDSDGVRRKLQGVIIANKTGALDALRSEVALVYSKGGKIAIAITVDGMAKPDWSPDNPGSLLIAGLAPMLVEGLAKK
ncbi:MAG: serine hydrolase [Acidobacteria bacterium]|nr:serine hydrolase [Acidobacteriota bacterium]